MAIGAEIAKINNIKIGDEVVLAFGRGNINLKSMPALERFKVSEIINHGIYQKDARLVYARLEDIQRVLELKDRVNLVSFNIQYSAKDDEENIEQIEKSRPRLREVFGGDFYFKPYWKEFTSLIEAVKVEKFMISLILQLVVVISIFNILAFIIFINEKKSKELFLFKALGLSKEGMNSIWLRLVFLMWSASCLLSIVFVQIFKNILLHLSFFELPAEIYYMPRIELYLTWSDYTLVFVLALVWIVLMKQKNLLEGLRQEFA